MTRVAVLAAVLSAWAVMASAQSATEPARRGGLLPGRAAESGLNLESRDELTRRWDLNADGQIDETEADIARTKMRRERRDLLDRSRIDPLTGKPRSAAATTAPPEEELVFPDPAAPVDPAPPKADGDKAAKPAPPKRDLNAGRPLGSLPNAAGTKPFTKPLAGPLSGTAALTPRPRGLPPATVRPGTGRPGTVPTQPPLARPAQPARPVSPSRPAPTFPTRPRVTAEEIGGP